ncbi:alcohol dehydrogenase [Blastomyces silverae]|uniref:Alcohol dehydrogenase n=1 Tax=Blastomyces silverae TaxID=2060906 RepID=A0A0H1BNK7_9EURO|nr:alcohol dehydrogenase [Blastomyces silverae]
MAKEYGIGMVAVRRSNHFGMSASFVRQAVDAEMMSLVFTNSSPALPAWGGKIYKAQRRGEKIPEGWALDGNGAPTTDPAAALKGVMLPMGGPKGSALAIMMDVFSGVLSGSSFAGHVTGPYDTSKEADAGHFVVAIKPDLFMDLEEFKARMDYLYQRVVGGEKMEGVDRIYYPGEIELLTAQRRREEGIPYVQAEIEALNREADRVGVAHLDRI